MEKLDLRGSDAEAILEYSSGVPAATVGCARLAAQCGPEAISSTRRERGQAPSIWARVLFRGGGQAGSMLVHYLIGKEHFEKGELDAACYRFDRAMHGVNEISDAPSKVKVFRAASEAERRRGNYIAAEERAVHAMELCSGGAYFVC